MNPAPPSEATVVVRYWSWFRELAGTDRESVALWAGMTLGDLLTEIHRRHPRLAEVRRATLLAVGLDYQPLDYVLNAGDEVSLLPPVQGG